MNTTSGTNQDPWNDAVKEVANTLWSNGVEKEMASSVALDVVTETCMHLCPEMFKPKTTPLEIDLTQNMVQLAELSSGHVKLGDMERIETFIAESKSERVDLDSIDGEAHLGFQSSYHTQGVFINLGTVYSDDKLERELDYDVYVLCMENGFSREFGQLMVTLRKLGLSYAVLDGDAEVCPGLPTYEW